MSIKNLRIEACADVRPGYSAKSAIVHDPEGSLQVITAQHLNKGEAYRYREDHALRIVPPKFYEKYLVSAGDILFMSRGANNYAVLIETVFDPTIAPLTFFIIRPGPTVLSEYLAWYLNSDMMKVKLNEIRAGAGTPMIPTREFRELIIPLPLPDVQQKISQIGQLQMQEKRLLQQLMDETNRLHQAIDKSIIYNSTPSTR